MALLHSPAFREQALVKVYSRGLRDIASVAQELNINVATLKGWMRDKSKREKLAPGNAAMSQPAQSDKRPQDWKPAEQLLALMQTHGLSEEQRNAWCRENGLFAHHLVAWQQAFSNTASSSTDQQQLRGLKDENHLLKRELVRKEKALAEAAALLVLQKKFRAMWEDEAK
jgi:transposase